MDRVSELIEHLLSNPDSDDYSTELLAEYHCGSPIGSLQNLLQSRDERIVGEGVWIASELGEAAKSLLPEIGPLLRHASKKVRFWAIDCVHLWADSSSKRELASAITLLEDVEEAVRWKAMTFVALSSRDKIAAALDELSATTPASPFAAELKWLLSDQGTDPGQIEVGLRSTIALHRKIAAAAAARIAKLHPQPLRCAVDSGDPEVAQFAKDIIRRVQLL
jgi:hypothetical protein